MLELPELSLYWIMGILLGASGAASHGVSVGLKMLIDGLTKRMGKEMPDMFYNGILRLSSVLVGAAVGWAMMHDAVGASLGAGAGALNTFAVWLLKRRAKALAGDEGQEPPEDA